MTPPTMPGLPPLSDSPAMGVRRFGRVNWLGLRTLARREVMRFMAVWQQTIFAPLMTAGLFVVEFARALCQGRGEIRYLPSLVFLRPGFLMKTVSQNAVANTPN
ncbi:MAG: multidrug ABC transporter permease, partial [Paracoccus marcusii]